MPLDPKELRKKVLVERVTVSCALTAGRRGSGDFVSLTVRSSEGDFTLEEAHMVHKIVSREATEMAYMDALAKGHLNKNTVARDLTTRKRNYDSLIRGLQRKSENQAPTAKPAIDIDKINEAEVA